MSRIDLPIACSLEGAALDARTDAWSEVLKGAESRVSIVGGIQFRFDGDATGTLQPLIDEEAACCPWMSIRLSKQEGKTVLSISSPDPLGERQILEWFS
ncbi:MAG: hypothetical protein QOG16_1024 [Actinomycetota bacterium]|jgi:hypothetical protein|nr:hypothetical protein [Actinomycetota bacterium]